MTLQSVHEQDGGVGANGAKTIRTLRVGLLGLGGVGQAVARQCAATQDVFAANGLRLDVRAALVRDVQRPREYVPGGAALVSDADAFFGHEYDLVIEALGGVAPAFELVQRALAAGTPVVTANKSLVAARGEALFEAAAQHDTHLLCEAAVIAGMPLLTLLQNRPLAARVGRLSGIVNGTTNFVLSAMEHQRLSLVDAVQAAQELGYAEPDPAADIQGVDAAEKLVILLLHLGVRGVGCAQLEVDGIEDVTVADLLSARELGGTLKLIAHANLTQDAVAAYVGPTFVPAADPLANLNREQNGVRIQGVEIGRLFYSGPGAGPDFTACTLLDDVIELFVQGAALRSPLDRSGRVRACQAPTTPWFVRLRFPQGAPAAAELPEFLAAQGVWFWKSLPIKRGADGDVQYAITHAASRTQIRTALEALRAAVGCAPQAFRVLED